jgi:hypothetical protein
MDWKTTRFYALLTLLVSLGFAAAAGAQETSTEETTTVVESSPVLPMSLSYFQPRYSEARWDVHRIKANKCRTHTRPHVWPDAGEVAPGYREERLARTRARRERVRRLVSRCLPTSMTGIIRYVFPSATENAAISVAQCESNLNPTAQNASSGAAGLFQLMPGWWQGSFNPFDPWANSRFAYRLSDAGYNWAHWVCKPW